MSLFKECMEALGKHANVPEKNVSEKILDKFYTDFPLTTWGRINWNKIREKKTISSINDIIPAIVESKQNPVSLIYIIGSDPTIPIIESKLDKILECFDDVEAVSPNTWLYCPTDGWIVEIYHEGEITLGFV